MLKRFFTLALLVIPLFAAGSVIQVGPTRLVNSASGSLVGLTYTLTLTVTGDSSSGTVPSTVLNAASGDLTSTDGMTIVSMVTDPGSPAPTTLYDIVVTDARGYDLLGATGANRSATVTENAAPTAPVPINGAITFALSNNSVASAVITVVITMTNTTVAKNGGSSSGSYAPNDATYLLQTANASLANAQAMGALATGLVKNTTTTGVQSIAVAGTDFISPTPLTGSTQLLYDSAAGTVALSPLFREDANTVAQRNGTTGQNFYSYNTYSSAGANYERFQFGWTANAATIFVDKLGTGATRNLNIQTYGTITLLPGNNTVATFFGNGNVAFAGSISNSQGTLSGSSTPAYTHTATWSNVATTFVDDFRNITDTNSASGSLLAQWQVNGSNVFTVSKLGAIVSASTFTAPTVTSSGEVVSNLSSGGGLRANSGGWVYWNNRSGMQSPSDGVIKLHNQADTDFTRLQFGGTTSSFPALKRSTTDLQVKLADDSAFTNIQAKYKSSDGTAGANTTCTIAGLTSIVVKDGLVTSCS